MSNLADKLVPLKDFIGTGDLYGAEIVLTDDGSEALLFRYSEQNYIAQCDPCDGYRSMLNGVYISDRKLHNRLPGKVNVFGRMRDGDCDILDLFELGCGWNYPILSIGTDHANDWYPICILGWYPENLSVNRRRQSETISESVFRELQDDFANIISPGGFVS